MKVYMVFSLNVTGSFADGIIRVVSSRASVHDHDYCDLRSV